jgi:hypothetical protein
MMARHSTGLLVRGLVAGRQLLVTKRQPSGNLIPATGGSPPIDSRHAMPLVPPPHMRLSRFHGVFAPRS